MSEAAKSNQGTGVAFVDSRYKRLRVRDLGHCDGAFFAPEAIHVTDDDRMIVSSIEQAFSRRLQFRAGDEPEQLAEMPVLSCDIGYVVLMRVVDDAYPNGRLIADNRRAAPEQFKEIAQPLHVVMEQSVTSAEADDRSLRGQAGVIEPLVPEQRGLSLSFVAVHGVVQLVDGEARYDGPDDLAVAAGQLAHDVDRIHEIWTARSSESTGASSASSGLSPYPVFIAPTVTADAIAPQPGTGA